MPSPLKEDINLTRHSEFIQITYQVIAGSDS